MTSLSDVYGIFLSKISDYSFLSPTITQADIDEQLLDYYDSASSKFLNCKKKLNVITDSITGESLIEDDLTRYEIEIIIKLMLVEYMTPIVLSSEALKQSLSDKDFKIYSQANQLRELSLLYRQLQKEADKMMTKYSYIGMTDENGRK